MFELLEDLTEWKVLGLKLGLSYPTLKKIECDEHGLDNRKMAMLHEWLAKGGATRQSLASALRRMEENRLADRVLTISVTAADLPPPDITTHTLTEEPPGETRGKNLQAELYCYVENRGNCCKIV